MKAINLRPIIAAVIAITMLACLAGCGDDGIDCPQSAPLPPPPLSGIQDTILACEGRYRLTAELWRDFMPFAPENGRPLTAVVTLIEIDGQPVDPTMSLGLLWVVTSDGYWSTRFNEGEYPPPSADRIVRAATCGPKWEPGTTAEVVVSYGCGEPVGQFGYIKVENVPIRRTD